MLEALKPYIFGGMAIAALAGAVLLPFEFRRCHMDGRSFLTGRPRG